MLMLSYFNRGLLERRWVVILVVGVCVSVRLLHYSKSNQLVPGETVSISSRLLTAPSVKRDSTWNSRHVTIECPRRIPQCLQLGVGDKVNITGEIKEAWYPGWFARPRLLAQEVSVVKKGEHAPALSVPGIVWRLGLLRQRISLLYTRSLEQPHAGLLSGIVLGERALLPETFADALSATGTMHVIAASGYNVSVITLVSLSLLSLVFPRNVSLVAAGVLVTAYALLAGGNPAIIRAAIMGLFAYAAQLTGREYIVGHTLIMTSLLMLFFEPWLLHDLSFGLSISATWGIIWGTPVIDSLLKRIGRRGGRDHESIQKKDTKLLEAMAATGFSTTLAAILATLPFSAVVFDRVSLVAPLINALVLWLVAPLMALGAFMAGAGLVWSPLAHLLALLAHPLLTLFIELVELGSRVPMATIPVSGMHWLTGVGYWLSLAAWWHTTGTDKHADA